MCTLVVGHRLDPELPLLVGANRDEALGRPSSPPALRDEGPLEYVAPRDELAGGTWLGINEAGLFAALTNRFGPHPDPDRNTRGELVPRALGCESADEAAEALGGTEPDAYNGFHLVVADDEAAHVVVSDGRLLTTTPLSPGFAVVTERSFGAADNRRKRRLRAELLRRRGEGAVGLDDLKELLSRRTEDGSIDDICVSLDEIDYGTRSSTLIRRGTDETTFLHAEGPPCETEYEDLSNLIAELDRRESA